MKTTQNLGSFLPPISRSYRELCRNDKHKPLRNELIREAMVSRDTEARLSLDFIVPGSAGAKKVAARPSGAAEGD